MHKRIQEKIDDRDSVAKKHCRGVSDTELPDIPVDDVGMLMNTTGLPGNMRDGSRLQGNGTAKGLQGNIGNCVGQQGNRGNRRGLQRKNIGNDLGLQGNMVNGTCFQGVNFGNGVG